MTVVKTPTVILNNPVQSVSIYLSITDGILSQKVTAPFNNYYYYYYYYYLVQLGCHPVAVVILHVNKT